MPKTKKRWTASEDKVLRLALKEGLSAGEVARNLGRSASSVSARKVSLGIKGRFSRSTKVVVQTNKVIRAMEGTSKDPAEVFELESGVEMPARFSAYSKEKEKLRNTFAQMSIGQSFIITGNLVHIARTLANVEFPELAIKIVHTTPDKQFARVFRKA